MRNKKEKTKISDKKLKGIMWSIVFTLFVPIGFVFMMGFLSQSFMVLYSYTQEIFVMFIVLLCAGVGLMGFQIYSYVKVDTKKSTRRKLKKFKIGKKEVPVDSLSS